MMGIVISKEGQKKKGGGSSGEIKEKKEFSKCKKSIHSLCGFHFPENWVALLGTYKMWLFSCFQY